MADNNTNGNAASDPTAAQAAAAAAQIAQGFQQAPTQITSSGASDNGNTTTADDATPRPVIYIPDIRNGTLETIGLAAPRTAVNKRYKWVSIKNLPHAQIEANIEPIIRVHYAYLMAYPPPGGANETAAKNEAIILGSIRAGAMGAWRLAVNDMIVAECVLGCKEWSNGRLVDRTGTANQAGQYYAAMPALTETEWAVISALVFMGIAIPVMQGASLVATGHHFLPTTMNIFAGMHKQVFAAARADIKGWIESRGDNFSNLAFHAATHPVNMSLKRDWAQSREVAIKLNRAGHSAASIRLPALPTDANSLKAAIAVMEKAAETLALLNATVDVTNARALIRAVEEAGDDNVRANATTTARNHFLAHTGTIAICAGIVGAVAEETFGTSTRETTLRAYSIKAVIAAQPTRVNRGQAIFREASRRMREALTGDVAVTEKFVL